MTDLSDDLSDAANEALGDPEDDGVGEGQMSLPGTETAKVKFVGMSWDALEAPGLKEELEFTVKGMVVGHGEEVMANGEVRETVKVKVTSVKRHDPPF